MNIRKTERKIYSAILSVFTVFAVISAVLIGATDYTLPEKKAVVSELAASGTAGNVSGEIKNETEITAKLLGIPLKNIEVNVIPKVRVIPCGSVFGVKFFTKGVLVVGMSDVESTDGIINPAYKAGLRVGDVITSIDNNEVNTVEEVAQKVDRCNGEKLNIKFMRDGQEKETSISPLLSLNENKYKTGLWVRDSTAGIGTITYYNPDTGEFAGLGHGICDIDTGELMPMLRASVVDITITDIIKGVDGHPGELKGSFGIMKNGELYKNSDSGVFGNLLKAPKCAFDEPVELGASTLVHEGEAYIYASLGDNEINKYRIELVKIYRNDAETKNFIFKVQDEELLKRTGGIVQGMSGSPIIQDGKLVGAVTHVMVNDPTRGYGIFIENMLSRSSKTED